MKLKTPHCSVTCHFESTLLLFPKCVLGRGFAKVREAHTHWQRERVTTHEHKTKQSDEYSGGKTQMKWHIIQLI